MNYNRNRKYPRVYEKKSASEDEGIFDLSVPAAIGVLAFVFLKGMFWGYILKRRWD